MNPMTRQDFLNKVYNYETGSEWKFQGQKPCVIDFFDSSCDPCRALDSNLEKLHDLYHDRVDFFKVDVKAEKNLAQELGIKGLPTLVFCPMDDRPVVLMGVPDMSKLKFTVENDLLRGLPEAGR